MKKAITSIKDDNQKAKTLLDFIYETKKGKFSNEGSIIENISFSRILLATLVTVA